MPSEKQIADDINALMASISLPERFKLVVPRSLYEKITPAMLDELERYWGCPVDVIVSTPA